MSQFTTAKDWTLGTPTHPGWYWYSYDDDVDCLEMVLVRDYGGGAPLWVKSMKRSFWLPDWQSKYGGWWMGPVRAPELPTELLTRKDSRS